MLQLNKDLTTETKNVHTHSFSEVLHAFYTPYLSPTVNPHRVHPLLGMERVADRISLATKPIRIAAIKVAHGVGVVGFYAGHAALNIGRWFGQLVGL